MTEARVVFGEKFILHSGRINSEFILHSALLGSPLHGAEKMFLIQYKVLLAKLVSD